MEQHPAKALFHRFFFMINLRQVLIQYWGIKDAYDVDIMSGLHAGIMASVATCMKTIFQ